MFLPSKSVTSLLSPLIFTVPLEFPEVKVFPLPDIPILFFPFPAVIVLLSEPTLKLLFPSATFTSVNLLNPAIAVPLKDVKLAGNVIVVNLLQEINAA